MALTKEPQPGNNLTNLNKTAKHGSYAHFPGTGPSHTFCEKCSLYSPGKKGKGFCTKFKQLMGFKGSEIRGSSQSCKYFE